MLLKVLLEVLLEVQLEADVILPIGPVIRLPAELRVAVAPAVTVKLLGCPRKEPWNRECPYE